MRSRKDRLDRPSGAVLPLLLRDKLKQQLPETGTTAAASAHNEKMQLVPPRNDEKDVVFTAVELEERLNQASSAIMDIQRQLTKGEELYYEETNHHGNLFRGWDAFVDAKDTGSHNSGMPGVTNHHRRIPVDNRWFSSSCTSAIKTKPLLQSLSSRCTSKGILSTTVPLPLPQTDTGRPPLPSDAASSAVISDAPTSTPVSDEVVAAIESTETEPKKEEGLQQKSKESNEKSLPTDTERVTPATESDTGGGKNVKGDAIPVPSDSKPPGLTPPARRTTRKRKAGD